MDTGIFKAYDIRGEVPKALDADTAYKLGKAYADYFHPKTVVVGRDMRVSSEELFAALTKGLREQGVNVIDIGLTPTPVMYFAVKHLNADGGLNVTASHNPGKDNGFKVVAKDAIPVAGETGIYDLRDRVAKGVFEQPASTPGTITAHEGMIDAYIKRSMELMNVTEIKPLHVVIDTGNGMAGPLLQAFFKHFPQITMTHLYPELDGNFPNHLADPLDPENLRDAQKKVRSLRADLGIVFDGDGDRIVMIDETGEPITADFLTALIAKEVLKNHHGEKVMYDLRSSWITKEIIEQAGGVPVMCRVGHSYIKQMMRENGAVFAGELSGHIYFRDIGMFEAPLMTVLAILQLRSDSGKKMSELVAPLRKYFASGEINSDVEDKDGKMKELEQRYKDGAKDVSWMDGIRIEFDDWWFNVRPSNTEPKLRLNLEARNKELMEQKRDEVLKIIRS